MKERPILFAGPMVLAILTCAKCGHISVPFPCEQCGSTEFLKTQTRRVMKPQPEDKGHGVFLWNDEWVCASGDRPGIFGAFVLGDRLWVRETLAFESDYEYAGEDFHTLPTDGRPIQTHMGDGDYEPSEWHVIPRYRATEAPDLACEHKKCEGGPCQRPWTPSIFMPRWASRVTLEITDVRVQRVQEISAEGIIAEGISTTLRESEACYHLREQWESLWNSINAKRGFGWEKNPWVWVISFKRVQS